MKLRKAGFCWLVLGIESASKHVRDGVEKSRFGTDEIIKIVRKVQDAGIYVIGNFIFGLPDDTFESMQEILDLAIETNCEFANFYSAMAYPGSKLYNLDKEKVIGIFSHTSETAYPILKKQTENAQRAIQHQTFLKNLFVAGRTGMFQYKMTEGSYDSAIDCANLVHAMLSNTELQKDKSTYDFSDSFGRPNQIPE